MGCVLTLYDGTAMRNMSEMSEVAWSARSLVPKVSTGAGVVAAERAARRDPMVTTSSMTPSYASPPASWASAPSATAAAKTNTASTLTGTIARIDTISFQQPSKI